VTVDNLFYYGSTEDYPTVQFTIPGIENPRVADKATGSFKIKVYEDNSKAYLMFTQEDKIFSVMRGPN
jgi:hypothetical protein